jgi:hypothetical protein
VLTNGGTVIGHVLAGGCWDGGNNVINGVRFLYSSGTVADGKIHIYGVKTS